MDKAKTFGRSRGLHPETYSAIIARNLLEGESMMRKFSWMFLLLLTVSLWVVEAGTLRDNFNDNDVKGWAEITVPLNRGLPFKDWQVIDGELHIENQEDNIGRHLIIGKNSWKDYVFEIDVGPIKHWAKSYISLVARIKDGRSFSCTIGDLFGVPEVTVFQGLWAGAVANNQKRKPFELLKVGKWHHLKLKAEGNDFTIWINDQKVIEYQDGTLAQGRVGFGLGNYKARFDNVVITGPDVPDINQGLSIDKAGKLASVWAKLKIYQ